MPLESSQSHSDRHAFKQREWPRDLADWFHQHGVAWSGTPAEFALQLSAAGLVEQALSPDTQSSILSLLELNIDELHRLGVDVSIHRARGRARTVALRRNAASPSYYCDERVDHVGNLSVLTGALSEPEDVTPQRETTPVPSANAFELLDALLKVPSDQPTTEEEISKPERVDLPNEFASLESVNQRSSSTIPIVVTVLVVLIGLTVFLILYNKGAFASAAAAQLVPDAGGSEQQDAPTPEASQHAITDRETRDRTAVGRTPESQPTKPGKQSPPTRAGVDIASIQWLTEEATKKRNPAAQYELGMSYIQGRGLPADKVKGYAWLVVALNNGESRSDRALRDLAPRLSSLDLQQVRLALGDHYSRGLGVPADLVAAHSWFALAEVAGSAEGTLRKKQLEATMTPEQIEQAEEKTTAWLTRH